MPYSLILLFSYSLNKPTRQLIRDYLLFYEYFHGDDGSGLDASHQTGWTGTLASLLMIFGSLDREELLKNGMQEVVATLADSPDDTPEQIR